MQVTDARRCAHQPRQLRVLLAITGIVALVTLLVTAGVATVAARSRADARWYYGGDPTAVELAMAVSAGDHDHILQLVADGAEPDAFGRHYITMLQWAIESGSPDGLAALLEAGARPDRRGRSGQAPLHDAAHLSDPRYAQILLAAGADPNVRIADTGTTALRETCLAGAEETFEVLVAGGADLEAMDKAGDRALHVCARARTGALVLRLLELGADPTARNAAGSTFQDYYFSFDDSLLSQASVRRHRQTVDWLLDHQVALVADAERYR